MIVGQMNEGSGFFMVKRWLCSFILLMLLTTGVLAKAPRRVIRVGYFPNITHAQAVVGIAEGFFQRGLGKDVKLETYLFNAGPSAMEALLAGQLDMVYVGPNPAINCFLRSNGSALRIVSGCCSGGAGMVARKGVRFKSACDLRGKRIATPQLGNTQDVALRGYILENRMKTTEQGGDVRVLPTANNNMLLLFQRREVDVAWTVEPWVSRLILEGGGRLILDERSLWKDGKFTTAIVVASTKFLKNRPDLVKRWIELHVEMTEKVNKDPKWALRIINKELERITGKPMPEEVLKMAWKRLDITYDPISESLFQSADQAYQLGFIDRKPKLKGIFDLAILNEVLNRKGYKAIR